MLKIGITGQNGFVGSYLFNTLGLHPDEFKTLEFEIALLSKSVILPFIMVWEYIALLMKMINHINFFI